jgi:hypothetical protein
MKLLGIAVLLMLTGCVGLLPVSGPRFGATPIPAAPPGQALLIVYRAQTGEGMGASIHIYADGRAVAMLMNASFVYAYAKPGQHTFTAVIEGAETIPLVETLDAGSTHYLRASFDFRLGRTDRALIEEVPATDARPELAVVRSLGHGYDIRD